MQHDVNIFISKLMGRREYVWSSMHLFAVEARALIAHAGGGQMQQHVRWYDYGETCVIRDQEKRQGVQVSLHAKGYFGTSSSVPIMQLSLFQVSRLTGSIVHVFYNVCWFVHI